MGRKESSQLKRVHRIESLQIQKIPQSGRPGYHMSSPVGWMNDPNGFSVFQGEYHLFFQYHPYSGAWGPMHWGHCKTRDFIKWEYLPAAMAPDESYDEGGCYSGSALETEDGRHVLIYTGVADRYLEDGTHYYRQMQCMAVGDGRDYEKFEGNPVITGETLPEGASVEDFRDPKVWQDEEGCWLVVGNRAADGSGQILLYKSKDLERWEFVTVLDRSENRYGKMWECPDFFPLDGRQILLVSPQDMRAEALEFHNGNNSIYLAGTYDAKNHQFHREMVKSLDYGLDFYAPQTLLTPDGRRIMIGWMQSWDAKIAPAELGWVGMMTIPRELHFENGRLYQRPVRELEAYRSGQVVFQNVTIRESTELEGVRGRQIDLTVEITGFDFEHFRIQFASSGQYCMVLQYSTKRGCLTIDRTHSGLIRDVVCRRKMEVRPMETEDQGRCLRLRLLLDKYSAEIFVNDGESVMSSVFYTPQEADRILFDTDGTACIHVTKYDIAEEK
ncbi:MAG: glycoside hydrolase family 32 protein [Eubacteriales bacterium]|nr:glycoside hydrolase family 32 protein [Eubacteriales bacterium]